MNFLPEYRKHYSAIAAHEPNLHFTEAGTKDVRDVNVAQTVAELHKMPNTSVPNSVMRHYRDGELNTERYFDESGKAYLDVDYTNHGNEVAHPIVPHQHHITFEGNRLIRQRTGERCK